MKKIKIMMKNHNKNAKNHIWDVVSEENLKEKFTYARVCANKKYILWAEDYKGNIIIPETEKE